MAITCNNARVSIYVKNVMQVNVIWESQAEMPKWGVDTQTPPYQYSNSNNKDNFVSRPLYLYSGYTYSFKMVFISKCGPGTSEIILQGMDIEIY